MLTVAKRNDRGLEPQTQLNDLADENLMAIIKYLSPDERKVLRLQNKRLKGLVDETIDYLEFSMSNAAISEVNPAQKDVDALLSTSWNLKTLIMMGQANVNYFDSRVGNSFFRAHERFKGLKRLEFVECDFNIGLDSLNEIWRENKVDVFPALEELYYYGANGTPENRYELDPEHSLFFKQLARTGGFASHLKTLYLTLQDTRSVEELLTACTSITDLTLHGPDIENEAVWQSIRRAFTNKTGWYDNLQKLTMREFVLARYLIGYLSLDKLMALASLNFLTHLNLSNLPAFGDFPDQQWPSRLKSLCINEEILVPDFRFLCSCRFVELETLELNVQQRELANPLYWDAIHKAMKGFVDSVHNFPKLQTLDIKAEYCGDALAGLHRFSNTLTSLTVYLIETNDYEFRQFRGEFPKVEYLIITDARYITRQALSKFTCTAKFPVWKVFRIYGQGDDEDTLLCSREKIEDLAVG